MHMYYKLCSYNTAGENVFSELSQISKKFYSRFTEKKSVEYAAYKTHISNPKTNKD